MYLFKVHDLSRAASHGAGSGQRLKLLVSQLIHALGIEASDAVHTVY